MALDCQLCKGENADENDCISLIQYKDGTREHRVASVKQCLGRF